MSLDSDGSVTWRRPGMTLTSPNVGSPANLNLFRVCGCRVCPACHAASALFAAGDFLDACEAFLRACGDKEQGDE